MLVVLFVMLQAVPVAVAIGAWTLAARWRRGWVVHVLFLPILLTCEWVILYQFYRTADNGHAPWRFGRLGAAFVFTLPLSILALTAICYYAAVGVKIALYVRRKQKAKKALLF
jgi:hypothetical protein